MRRKPLLYMGNFLRRPTAMMLDGEQRMYKLVNYEER
jgi:hypothetical protein